MRFLVDFYRYVIFAGLALMIVGLVYITMVLATQDGRISELGLPVLVIGGLLIGLYVMSLGMIATFISLHDRHAEIAYQLRGIREDLAARGE